MGSLANYHSQARDRRLEEIPCCLCGAPPRPYAIDYNGNRIARCASCGLRFVSPRPPLSVLAEHVYEDRYYVEVAPRSETLQDNDLTLDRLAPWKRPPGRLLDVGCSTGLLLEAAQRRGWDVEGLDISQPHVEAVRRRLGCPVHAGLVEELKFKARYDALTIIHVLEHTLDPRDFLIKCRSLLKPGGVAYLVFPNTHSLNDRLKSALSRARLKARRWKHFAADHHLWFFTPAVARRLCAEVAFPIQSLKTIHPRRKLARPAARPLLRCLEWARLGPWLELVLRRP